MWSEHQKPNANWYFVHDCMLFWTKRNKTCIHGLLFNSQPGPDGIPANPGRDANRNEIETDKMGIRLHVINPSQSGMIGIPEDTSGFPPGFEFNYKSILFLLFLSTMARHTISAISNIR
jgi:hypothetical protein